MASSYQLTVDGTPLPAPKRDGVVISTERVWSSNTGRTASGKMVGDVIAQKTTVQITWNTLSHAQAELVRAAVCNASKDFSTLVYTDLDGNVRTLTVYFGTPTFTIHSTSGGGHVTSVSVTAVEQ